MEAFEEGGFVDLFGQPFVDCWVREAVHLGEIGEEFLLVVDVVNAELEFGNVACVEVEPGLFGGCEGLVGAEGEVGCGCGKGGCSTKEQEEKQRRG